MINPASPVAHTIAALFGIVFWIAAGVFLLVEGLLLYAVIRYRARGGETPKEVHGHGVLELAWTIIPAAILAVLTVLTMQTTSALSQRPHPELMVRVEGFTWAWEFQYPGGVKAVRALRIPAGRPVLLEVTSRDVVHSFWAAELGGKTDAVPGQVNLTWIQADRPGVFRGQCVEFCGFGHPGMFLEVVAMEPEEFASWLRAEQARLDVRASPDQGSAGRR